MTCPTSDQLDRWVNERLDPAEQAALAAHIDDCANCQAELDQLTAQPATAKAPPDPQLDDLLRQLKDTLPGKAPTATDADRPVVPGYDLIEVIGRGGMGVVFRARQRGVNREVAIKLLHRGAADTEDAARFRREGEALGKLQHPNVVQVFDVGMADGRPFLVMEYVPGGALSKFADGKPQSAETAAALAEQVARAVQHAHENGILHRDLKPGNILLGPGEPGASATGVFRTGNRGADRSDSRVADAPGSPGQPKVADFGLARSIEPGESLTLTGMILGTPGYMAPEQVAGDQRLTPACDVYGLGAVFYELLTGRPPFAGANPADVLVQVRNQEPVPPSRVIPTLPRDLNTICLRCLEKEPKNRYPSAGAVAEDLRRWRAGEPILARPTGTIEKAWKWARRRKAAAAAVGLGLFLLVVGLPTVTVLGLWAERERRKADANFDRADRALYAAHITQAENQYQLNDPARMRFHIDACEPEPGRTDRRGWEWAYLRGLAYAEYQDLDVGPRPDDRARAMYAVAFDPTGTLVTAGGGPLRFLQNAGDEPGEFGVWDVVTGRPVLDPPGRDDRAVVAVTFGPGGRLFTVSVHVWKDEPAAVRARDARTGAMAWETPLAVPSRTGPRGTQPDFAVSPDGARLLVQTVDGVTVLDARTGREAFRVTGASAAAFRAGGAELVTVIPGTGRLAVRDSVTGAVRTDLAVESPRAAVRAFSPSGRLFARTTADGDILVTPTDDGRPVVKFRPVGLVTVLAFDHRDRMLVTAGPNGTVRVWDLPTARLRRVFVGHANRVTGLAVSLDGTQVVSVGWDQAVKVWDLTRLPGAGNVGTDPPPGRRRVEDCAFTPDGRELLVVRVPGELERWDPAADVRRAHTPLDLPADTRGVVAPGRTAAFSAGGTRVAAVSARRSVVKVWDTDRPAEPVATLEVIPDPGPEPPLGPVTAVRFVTLSRDGTRVAAAVWSRRPEDRRLRAWDLAGAPRLLLDVPLADRACAAMAFSPNDRRLAAALEPFEPGPADPAGRVRRWDLDTGAEEPALQCGESVMAVAYDATGDRIAVSVADRRVLVWDAAGGRLATEIRGQSPTYELAFAPDGRRLAGASREELTLWDPATGDEVLTLRGVPRGTSDLPFNPRIAFDATGSRLAVGQWNFTINVWSAPGYLGR